MPTTICANPFVRLHRPYIYIVTTQLNTFCSFVVPITMGFGLSRSRVFQVFLLMTEQAMKKRPLADIQLVGYVSIHKWTVINTYRCYRRNLVSVVGQ
jgi:hypothetical protein